VSLMPAELPLRGGNILGEKAGLMDINEGLFNIVRQDPNNPKNSSYVDLVPKDKPFP